MKRTLTNIGYTPLEDGRFLVYELDWDHVKRLAQRLAQRAKTNKSGKTKLGPLYIKVSKTKS